MSFPFVNCDKRFTGNNALEHQKFKYLMSEIVNVQNKK